MNTDRFVKHVFIGIVLFISIFQFSFIAFAESSYPKLEYVRGFKLYQYSLSPGDSVADNPLPMAELNSFFAKKSTFSFTEVVKKSRISYRTSRLYRAFGYLFAKQSGLYTIIIESDGIRNYGCVFVNRSLVVAEKGQPLVVIAPVNLKQGKNEIDMRIYDNINNDLTARKETGRASHRKFSFWIKTPESDEVLPAHKVLLLELH